MIFPNSPNNARLVFGHVPLAFAWGEAGNLGGINELIISSIAIDDDMPDDVAREKMGELVEASTDTVALTFLGVDILDTLIGQLQELRFEMAQNPKLSLKGRVVRMDSDEDQSKAGH
jgi:hypothetical protein